MGSYVLYYTSTPARGASQHQSLLSTSRFLTLFRSLTLRRSRQYARQTRAWKKASTRGASGTAHEHTFFVDDLEGPVNDPIPAFNLRRRSSACAMTLFVPGDDPAPMPLPDLREFSINSERYQLGIFDNAEPLDFPPSEPPPRIVKPSDPSLRSGARNGMLISPHSCAATAPEMMDYPAPSVAPPATRLSLTFAAKHGENPLHRIEKWHCVVREDRENPSFRNEKWHSGFFVRTSLATLGLRVQLGHRPHERAPRRAGSDGVRDSAHEWHPRGARRLLRLRRAQDAGSPEIQLLRAGWFPATHERPQTCATITVLERFHQDTLQSKMTMYDFYGVLEKLTDNTGIKPPDRYHEWIRMCREFRHLMLLKRGGRAVAYTASGVEGTQQGELAIQCPACPRPDVNLPTGWENASPEDRYVPFTPLFLALDACFRLKRRLVSSELKDPDLGSGWAYMVETQRYREYLRGVTSQKEMNTCSGLAALDHANTKFSRGYSTTGVVMGVCGRHEFVQPNGVGDLQKGERFSNTDYVVASILILKDPRLRKFLTYDIACIWAIHLLERLKKLPPHVRLVIVAALIRFAIPKMHIHSHTLLCQLLYSLSIILGAAQLDAEGIERAWAGIGGVAASTRAMGPGARHDVLDCQWSHWNWQKLVGIVALLRRRLDRAKEELAEQTEALEEFSAQQAARVPEWRRQVLEFEHDPQQPQKTRLTEAQVRLQFTKEEADEAARGVPAVHDVSASSFISAGLDLEEDQRRVRLQAELKKAGTTGMQIDLAAMRTKLNRGIARFRKIQQAYMPVAVQLLGEMDLPPTTLAEDVPLLLPSALTEAQRTRCAGGLEHVEALMRDAQCRTALTRLRNQLHIKSRLLTYKKNHVRHQGANTRSRTIVTRNESKIRLHSEKYQTAWEAMRKLSGGNEELVGWRVLKREDIRCMEDTEDLRKKAKARAAREATRRQKTSEKRAHGMLPAEEDDDMEWEEDGGRGPENQRQISWIWVVAGTEGTDAGLENGLRVEWSKAFARTRRWGEEIRLLEEEYRRVCISFDYEGARWQARAAAVPVGVLGRAEAEGAVAYAVRHVEMYRDLKERAIKTWNEEKLARGKKRARHIPAVVGAMEAEARAERAARIEGGR
ncbi:CxC2 domain-containing protein [Mycena sanguinolenta]|uniref:CxC2 domain-containing protein n=1 Tax=Mycena sanguinolenta TaxID=230812 RepID=A0A8H6XNX3_9AGAR|nr:CxC2 domain-containing protein [Mycena sanguinolenta]